MSTGCYTVERAHIFSKGFEFQDVMCNPYASVPVSLRGMFTGIHMVALSMDCLMLLPSIMDGRAAPL